MLRFAIAFAIALALLLGSLFALRNARNRDMPPKDVIDRVKAREKLLEERERAEREDRP
jgi:hypothetical protein